MYTRRQFIHRGAVGAGAVMAGGALLDQGAALAGPGIPSFTNPLPLPATAQRVTDQPGTYGKYVITATERSQQLHPKLPATKVWTYDDNYDTVPRPSFPGPTIEVVRGETIEVDWVNQLPASGSIIDPWVLGLPLSDQGLPTMTPDATPRILTHVHGHLAIDTSDGNPYASPDDYGRGQTYKATYQMDQPATTLWYHDHVLGSTRLNVMAGLAGFFIVRDGYDTGLASGTAFAEGIPERAYDIPLVIQDRQFTKKTGQLVYSPPGTWLPEFFGDQILVNGGVSPFLNVEPRKYRFRLLNGSNARFYNLEIAGVPWSQIGSEGGLFAAAVPARQILLLPGERADVVVDFSAFAGQTLLVKNRSLPPGIVSPAKPFTPNILQLQVGTTVTPGSPGPTTNVTTISGGTNANLPPADVSVTRNIRLEEVLLAGAPVRLEINGKVFDDEVEEVVEAGATEEWRFINLSADTHPMHLHLVTFQVVSRQAFDIAAYMVALAALQPGDPSPDPVLIGPVLPPQPGEVGFKDTVAANPGEVTTIRAKFDVPAGASGTQKFVYHCHILEHEDNDMMRPFEVVVPTLPS